MQVDYVFRNLFPVGNTKRAPDTCMISLLGFKDETSLCGPELFAILALARGLMDKVHPEGEEKPESYTVSIETMLEYRMHTNMLSGSCLFHSMFSSPAPQGQGHNELRQVAH